MIETAMIIPLSLMTCLRFTDCSYFCLSRIYLIASHFVHCMASRKIVLTRIMSPFIASHNFRPHRSSPPHLNLLLTFFLPRLFMLHTSSFLGRITSFSFVWSCLASPCSVSFGFGMLSLPGLRWRWLYSARLFFSRVISPLLDSRSRV